jgi:hypothetical protein
MEKITYLLGAGASANVLPLIKASSDGKAGLPLALENLLYDERQRFQSETGLSSPQFDKLSLIVKKCKDFGTPDLAAKYYLEINDWHNYGLLKMLLSYYFETVQNQPDKRGTGFEGMNLDSRVVPFLTTISSKGKLPPAVKIISWNYDKQIEMGAKKLHPSTGQANDFSTNFNVWPFVASANSKEEKDYFLLHLNGICGHYYSERTLAGEDLVELDCKSDKETLLSFAWEDDDSFSKRTFTMRRIELATKMIENTTILVVIGYSFPFFNRNIDAELFKIIKPTLKKIYFQDPNLDGQFLYSQFGLYKEVDHAGKSVGHRVTEIEHIKAKSQYYVPYEL